MIPIGNSFFSYILFTLLTLNCVNTNFSFPSHPINRPLSVTSSLQRRSDPDRFVNVALFARFRRGNSGTFIKLRGKYPHYFSASAVILVLNIISFAISKMVPNFNINYMKINQRIAQGEIYRLFTPLFLHGSLSHIMMNSFSLKEIGPQVIQLLHA